ncbi:hypothetical protein EDB85DRAFT_1953285 [Lactarius pseudohatsudake]|nr:hypothetical protein EDB85DRAFT_1953285 [Lactarius pseudohatsudake]
MEIETLPSQNGKLLLPQPSLLPFSCDVQHLGAPRYSNPSEIFLHMMHDGSGSGEGGARTGTYHNWFTTPPETADVRAKNHARDEYIDESPNVYSSIAVKFCEKNSEVTAVTYSKSCGNQLGNQRSSRYVSRYVYQDVYNLAINRLVLIEYWSTVPSLLIINHHLNIFIHCPILVVLLVIQQQPSQLRDWTGASQVPSRVLCLHW